MAGCSSSRRQQAAVQADANLENVVWRLTQLDGKEVDKADKYEVTFFSGNRIAGIGECNRFFGPYQVLNGNGGIKIGPVASTMMACLDPNVEGEFFQMFENVRLYQFSGNQLYLFVGNEVNARAVFVATDKTPVTGE